MLRPNVRELLKNLDVDIVIEKLEYFIASKPKDEYYLANIDLLRLYGRTQQKYKFYKLALFLISSIKNPSIYREIARFVYFIEKDNDRASLYANKAININENEPLWVYYIARKPKTYFEKLYDGVYLTSIPKNASTSLKTMMLEELHNKKNINPHSIFGNPFFNTNQLDKLVTSDDLKLISTREPISRFISYFNKNIIEESSLQEELLFTEKLVAFGVPLKPSIEYFVQHLNIYCYIFNDVLHHVLPQTAYFQDLSIYDCVADLSESYKLGESVSKKLNLNNSITPPRKMVSKNNIDKLPVTKIVREQLLDLFSDDVDAINGIDRPINYSFKF